MTTDALCAAIWEATDWLPRFTRRDYEEAFQAYAARFGPLYTAAVRENGGEDAPAALAEALLDALETAWRRQRPWNRSTVRFNEKQVIVNFLTPMLMEQEEPLCAALAKALRRAWKARWPKEAYRVTTYAVLKSGFRNTIMGFELPDWRSGAHEEEPDED